MAMTEILSGSPSSMVLITSSTDSSLFAVGRAQMLEERGPLVDGNLADI